MDVTDEKIQRLYKKTKLLARYYLAHCLGGLLFFLIFVSATAGGDLALDVVYSSPGTWYMSFPVHAAKLGLVAADLYLYFLFLYESVTDATRGS